MDPLATLLCAALGYLLSELRAKRQLQRARERRHHPTQVSVILTDEIRNAIRPEVKHAAEMYFGALNRGHGEILEAMGRLNVKIGDAMGKWQDDKNASATERQAISDRLSALHLAIEALGKATSALSGLWS